MSERVIPSDMVEVTERQFFAVINPLNVLPSTQRPDVSVWEINGTREVVGLSWPGWKFPGEPKQYALVRWRVDALTTPAPTPGATP